MVPAFRWGEDSIEVTATAYNSHPSQTDDSPEVAAWGDRLQPGMRAIAVSRDLIPLGFVRGARVRVEGFPGRRFVVLDKMHYRWRRRIDIYMGNDIQAAREWGRRPGSGLLVRQLGSGGASSPASAEQECEIVNHATYRAAIIGLGFIGAADQTSGDALGQQVENLDGTHLGALAENPRIQLVAGSSRDQGRRSRFEERNGVRTYADWREMIATEALDLVSVATYTPVQRGNHRRLRPQRGPSHLL